MAAALASRSRPAALQQQQQRHQQHNQQRQRARRGARAAAARAAAPAATRAAAAAHDPTALPTGLVYRAECPLVGLEGLSDLLGPQLYSSPLGSPLALHQFVVVATPEGGAVAYDYLPLEPQAPATALTLLSGGSGPGSWVGSWVGDGWAVAWWSGAQPTQPLLGPNPP